MVHCHASPPRNRRQRNVAIERDRPVGRIGPRHDSGEVADDFPLRKQHLRLAGVRQLKWSEQETRRFEFRGHLQA